ncbi:hypothetical protein EBR16_01870 [bacterium]|nr:hypothetical protein [bacterium]
MIWRLFFLFVTTALFAAEPIRPFYGARPGALEKAKVAATTDEAAGKALKKLLADADKALAVIPPSVMQKTKVPPSGDKHDYMSIAPYFWPNPATKDGLPYQRKDGKVNPESRDEAANDTLRARLVGASVETLALGYYFSGDEKYAEHAAKILRTWFLDPATKMTPHFRFAQAVPGPAGTLPDSLLLARLAGVDAKNVWTELAAAVPTLAGLDGAKLPAEGVALDGAAWSHHKFPEGKLLKFAPVATA